MVSDVKYGSNDDVRPKNIVIHNSPQKKDRTFAAIGYSVGGESKCFQVTPFIAFIAVVL